MAGGGWRIFGLAACMALPGPVALAAPKPAVQVETIVLLRHGEKPAAGLGQLNCQGLNRALALPAVIATKFGRPAALFAPNPGAGKPDGTGTYDYVRPLATIEPAAISLGMPVNAGIVYSNVAALQRALMAPQYHAAVVVAVWEHHLIVELAKRIIATYHGDAAQVPDWNSKDFDSIYIVRIKRNSAPASAEFATEREGLNNMPEACPGAPK